MIKKKFLKTKCKITFELSDASLQDAKNVYLVGDFNEWDQRATPMESKKGNTFAISLDLDLNREYQYRYLVDGVTWYTDPAAEGYVGTVFQSENALVRTYQPQQAGVS